MSGPNASAPDVGEGHGAVVELEHVTKRYGPESAVPAVSDLSFTIPAGEICVLVGPSGCGKTTTMKMINRLVEPTSGRVLIDGEDVTKLPAVELRRRIGYVIQQVGLFPHMTVAENVAVVPRLLGWRPTRIHDRVEELLGLVGLDAEVYRGRYPAHLSGGERQRVGVARALAADPPVMLMDEPFGAVDPIRRGGLQNEFLRLQAQVRKTIVFVTHDVDEAIKMADRIAILRIGGILAQYDTPDAILSTPANDFVERFVGADRGLKRLSLARVRDLPLQEPVLARLGERRADLRGRLAAADVAYALLVDAAHRPLGWITADELDGSRPQPAAGRAGAQPADGVLTAEMASPGSTPVEPESTLRDALSVMLASSVQLGVVVDPHGGVRGVIGVDQISALLQQPADDGPADAA
jgi:osmoprotectant transport system ATP-binding protein